MNENPETPRQNQNLEPHDPTPDSVPQYSAPEARPVEHFDHDNKPAVVHIRSSKKRIFVVLLVLFVVSAAGGLVYWRMSRDDATREAKTNSGVQQTELSKNTTSSIQPDTLSYSFASSSNAASDVYWRSATGGERTKVLSIAGNGRSNPNLAKTYGKHVVYVIDIYTATPSADAGVWYSGDGGRSFSKVYTLSKDEQVTSVQFANEGTELLIAALPKPGADNTIKSIDLSTKQIKELFTSEWSGIFLKGYSTQKKQVLYFGGCYNCDGALHSKLLRYDLQTKTQSTLVDVNTAIITGISVNADFSQIVYVVPTQDSNQESDDLLRGYIGAPYTLYRRDLAATESSKLFEVGKLGDKMLLSDVGYIANNSKGDFYYAYGNQLFTKSAQNPVVFYEATQPILDVYYVDANTAIAASGTFENFGVARFDLESKKATAILQGDGNTNIFGITTK